jgi:hypothetical protein
MLQDHDSREIAFVHHNFTSTLGGEGFGAGFKLGG